MPSTYTTNLGIEKIATGEQSGSWGTTTNVNFDILDEAVNGIITITAASAGNSGSPNSLPVTDGASSNGRNKFIEINDGGDLGANVFFQLTPNNAEKILFIRNSLTTQDLILFQGTYNASNDIVVPNGKDMVVKFNGGGTGATVTDVFKDLNVTALTAATATIATADINGGAVDGTNIGAASAGTGNFSTLSIGGAAITSTAAELNILDGVTSTAAELNILDGVTATTAELNYVDGVTSAIQTQLDAKEAADADILKADTADTITAPMRGTVTAVSSSSNVTTFNMNTTNNFSSTTSENTDFRFSNETAGQSGNIFLVNAGHTISIDADVHIAAGDLTAINAAGNYFLSYFSPDGTNVYMSATPALVEGS